MSQRNRWSLLVVGICSLSIPCFSAYTWKSVPFYGGGYVPEMAYHPKSASLAYIRTDIGGAYRLDPSNGKDWIAINDMFTDANDFGSIGIGLDPDDTNYVYLTGGLYTSLSWCGGASLLRSADQGATWTKFPFTNTNVSGTNSSKRTGNGSLCFAGNGQGRGMGPRFAVKGTTIFLATNQNGLLKSNDRGATWTTMAPLGDTAGIGAVLFDAAGNVYAAPYAGGLWKSANGVSWAQLSGFNGVVYQMRYAPQSNKIWLTSNTTSTLDQGGTGGGSVWTFNINNSSFSQVSMPAKGGKDFGYGALSIGPSNSNHIIVTSNGWWRGRDYPRLPTNFVPHEAMYQSFDGGVSWKDILLDASFDTVSAAWASTSNPGWITALAIDPANPDHVTFGTGGGMWSTWNGSATKPTWSFTDKGIEETAVLGMFSSRSGAPVVSVMGDVDGAYHASVTAPPRTRHQVEIGTNFDISVASLAPNKAVRIHEQPKQGLGGFSEDGGKTWTAFATYPPFVANSWGTSNQSNYAAISADGSAIVFNMQQYGVYFSTNNGATWTKSSTDASLLSSVDGGFRVLADQVSPGAFYIYNAQTGIAYRSTNNGATWTATNSSLQKGDSWAWGFFRAFVSPKAAGEIWFTQGQQFSGVNVGENVVYRSMDGGATLTPVTGLLSATAIGFGKGSTDAIPAIYVYGVNSNNIKGLFRSIDNGNTWVEIDDPAHQYGGFAMIVGDPCIYSRIYVTGSAGRGILYGEEPGVENNTCLDRLDYVPASARIKNSMKSFSGISRDGMQLRSDKPITLFDIQGKIIRMSTNATMDLRGIHPGQYIAQSGFHSLQVVIHE